MKMLQHGPYDPPVCSIVNMEPAQVICESGTPGDDWDYNDIDEDL